MSAQTSAPKNCALILLASGLSERFETGNKLLAKLGDAAVIDSTIDTMSLGQFRLRVAVIGHNVTGSAALETKLSQAGYMVIVNSLPEAGQGKSLALGVRAVISAGYERACIVLADMPFVTREHVLGLMKLSQSSDQVISETNMDDRVVTLPPCVFSGQALLRLLKASGDKGAKSYFKAEEFSRLPLSYINAMDIDTQEDLQTAEHHLSLLRLSGRKARENAVRPTS